MHNEVIFASLVISLLANLTLPSMLITLSVVEEERQNIESSRRKEDLQALAIQVGCGKCISLIAMQI